MRLNPLNRLDVACAVVLVRECVYPAYRNMVLPLGPCTLQGELGQLLVPLHFLLIVWQEYK